MARTPIAVRRQLGFSLIEAIVVVMIVAILAAIAIPAIDYWIDTYRLGIASQMVTDQLQATKMQAVAKTRRLSVLFDVEGNRLGREGMPLVNLPNGVTFSLGEANKAPDAGVSIASSVTFPVLPEDSSLRAASFTGRGLPDTDPGQSFAVYLSNRAGTNAVVMTSAGNIRTLEWNDGGWK